MLPDPRWRKVLRDALHHKARSLIVVAAIAVGLVAASTLLNTWAIVRRATAGGFLASQPVSGTVEVDRADAGALALARATAGIAEVRARRVVRAAVRTSAGTQAALLYAYDAFDRRGIGQLAPDSGAWPPASGEVVIERSALAFSGATLGEPMVVTVGKGAPVSLPVTGVVRDVSQAPAWMEHLVYAYVTAQTLAQLGVPAEFNEIQFRVGDAGADRSAVRAIASDLRKRLEAAGYRVITIDVPVPGQHIHAAQMDSLLMTQAAFAVLSLIVCAFLVVNLMASLLAGQAHEIAVMKTIGAQPAQIARLYLVMAAGLGLGAALIALPVAAQLGQRYAAFKGELLNFPTSGYAIPLWVFLLEVAVAVLTPVLAAAVPVVRHCRRPVTESLRDVGIRTTRERPGRRRWLPGGLGRPVILAAANAFRRRQRMWLTVGALAAGGTVFIAAGNLRQSVVDSVDAVFARQREAVTLRLAQPHSFDAIESVAGAVPGATEVEAWRRFRAYVAHPDLSLGNRFPLLVVRADTPMIAPTLRQGRWIDETHRTGLVVSEVLRRDEPGLAVGATVTLQIEGQHQEWTVAGIVDAGPQAIAYAPRAALATLPADAGAAVVAVATKLQGSGRQLELVRQLREALGEAGMPVDSSALASENRRSVEDHLLMVVNFLGAMGWIMILVGAMGLASTMSLAVLERTREIGVLRAIGARHRAIVAVVVLETVVIGALGWLVSVPLSVPVSVALAEAFGRAMFAVPAPILPELDVLARWLVLTVAVAFAASLLPAWRALRIPAVRALSYQ
ncbi:ABC transporter permease [Tahibacter amnicola]|uniref:ABC transporter permease n=1 Tax=Tahibacter amnicola TaxID=2976241 RepID=A0ABY6BCL1_9GAMM|nr:ABC transporter permease [Tahibacter amnicola]UXI66860.1 ABC transporter permease [Tahibacter amnicola]